MASGNVSDISIYILHTLFYAFGFSMVIIFILVTEMFDSGVIL